MSSASAAPLIYRGNNPNISPGASPLNEAGIASRAELTRPKQKNSSFGTAISESTLLKQSVINGLSTHYQQILTGSSSGSGTINFGDGNFADYSTVGGVRTIIFRNADGTTTTISFPL